MKHRLALIVMAVGLICHAVRAQSLTGLRIEGPDQVDENTLTFCRVVASFDNGQEYEVTLSSYLWVEPGDYADIGVFGDFMTYEVPSPQVETIWAYYAFGAESEVASLEVGIENIFNVLGADPAPDSEVSAAPDAVTIELSEAADPNSVSLNVIRLVRSVDGEFGNGNDEEFTPASVELSDPTHIRVGMAGLPLPDDEYQVAVAAATPGYALNYSAPERDTVIVVRDAALEPSELTVEAWILPTDQGERNAAVCLKHSASGPGYHLRWQAEWIGWPHRVIAGAGGSVAPDSQTNEYLIGSWHHVAMTYSLLSDETSLLIDGVVVSHTPGPGVLQHSGNLGIGNTHVTTYLYRDAFDGLIDEFRIWNVARTEEDIQQDMHRPLRGDEPGLAGYWNFDEGAGQILHDLTGSGNNGTLGLEDDPNGDSHDPQWVVSTAPIYGVTDLDGNVLDGEFDGVFPSGDGAPGGDFVYEFSIRRVPGAFKVASLDPAPDSVLDLAPESIEVTFTEDVDEATVNSENVRLIRSVDGVFGNGDDETITPAALNLTDLRHVSMNLVGVELPNDLYEITLKGTGAGTALSFDGLNDRVRVLQDASLEPTNALTVEMWIYPTREGLRLSRILRKAEDFGPGYFVTWDSLERGHLSFSVTPSNVRDPAHHSTYLNAWHHIAGSYSGGGSLKLYIDGVLVSEEPNAPDSASHGSDLFFASGLPSPDPAEFWQGMLDEMRIWNVERTQDEIRRDMRRLLRGDEAGLVGYWKCDEGEGQLAADLSPFGNDGMLGIDADPNGDDGDPQWVVSTAPVGGLLDLGGNALDGEFSGAFPSGDGVPGGDFVCEFTLDQVSLVACDPANDHTLAKLEDNVIALVFDAPIALPPAGEPLVIVEIAEPNDDVSSLFDYDIDPDDPNGHTLLAQESGPQLANHTWYRIKPAWGMGIEPFTLDLCTLWGDADGSGRVTTADYSEVKAHVGEYTDARYDLNGSGRVTTADYSVVKGQLGDRAPGKP